MITKNSVLTVVLAVVLVASMSLGAVGGVAAQGTPTNETETPTSTPTPTPTPGSDGESTPTPTPGGENTNETDTGTVPEAETPARLFPVRFDNSWQSVEERDTAVYATTGGSVMFESPDDIDHVTIREPGANARVVGGNVIIVEFDDDAAAVGNETLFTMDILYADGDTARAQIYASQTNVQAGANDLAEYRPVILSALDAAEKAGYERSPEGLQNYISRLQEIKQVFDNLFVEKAKEALALVVAALSNPIVVLSGMLFVLGLLTWLLRRFSESLRILSEDPGRVERMRREIKNSYQRDQRTAADTRLRDVPAVGRSGEIYWDDAFDCGTLVELGELARGELPVRVRDGEIDRVGGVEDISASDIDESWIERVTRPGRLPSSEVAVAQMRAALHQLITEHSLGHIYRDAYAETDRLLDELDETHSSPGREAAGGDD